MRAILLLVLTLTCVGTAAIAQETPGTIRGIVLDRAGGTPLADVAVQIQDDKQSVSTGADGRFELTAVRPGRPTIYVSVVGFILVKRTVDLAPGQTVDLTIVLSEGTGTYSESVTVTAGRFREQETAVPAQQTLGSADIQNLRNLLTNDPMRAIQVLPGVTTGDDFRSEFAVRANGPSRLSFTFDGVGTSFLLHTIQQVNDGGSIAMLNGDVLDGITLLNGSYPQRYGNRLGAEVSFRMREGSRERTQWRLGVSGTDASVVTEGPLAGKRGSWLVSARKSYLELLLKQIDSTNDVGFGFSDLQSKVVYDVSSRNRVELSAVAGSSLLDRTLAPGEDGENELKDGHNAGQIVNVGWRFTPSATTSLVQRVAWAGNQFSNDNSSGVALDHGSGQDLTWRADLTTVIRSSLSLEGGLQVQRQQRELTSDRVIGFAATPTRIQAYDDSSVLASAYAQTRWSPSWITLSPGVRVDRWSLTGDSAVSPWLQVERRLTDSLRLRGGTGIHRQFPDFETARGLHAAASPQPERAYHADVGVEQILGGDTRWQVTVFNREERDVFRLPDSEVRLVGNQVVGPSLDARWENRLSGHTRGVELLVQRRSSTGLSGWASYAWGHNSYRDAVTGESFDGDFDQRHTVNLQASYRLSTRTTLGAKFRAGSNFPAGGYWEERNGLHFVSATRNGLRVPAYARLDLRGSRIFDFHEKRMTLFVELLNALNHENVRFDEPGVNPRTRQAFGLFDTMIPLVPSAGVLFEF